MSIGSGMPVTRILVLGCTENIKPLHLPHFLSNQCDFLYVPYFYIFVKHFSRYNQIVFENLFLTPPLPSFTKEKEKIDKRKYIFLNCKVKP